MLKNITKMLGSKIKVHEDFCLEVRNTRNRVIPYLKDAKRRGHMAFLNKEKFVINGRI